MNELPQEFKRLYPDTEDIIFCRAPGRANIIGEHTDYNGLPVLPMTIDRDIRIAFTPCNEPIIRMATPNNVYPPTEFRNQATIPPSQQGAWDNYCKAALTGLNRHFSIKHYPGMNMLVTGTIPMAAGLSSSSALVVACALAYLPCLGKKLGEDITRLALADLLANAEQYVGTRGGGMDQAILLLGDENQACKIDFNPLRVERVPLLTNHVLVVCHSLVKADKSGSDLHRYNAGPRLSKLICALVSKHLQDEFGPEIEITRLGDLWYGHLCLTHQEIEALFHQAFPRPCMTLAEAATRLGLTRDMIRKRWLGELEEPGNGFPLQARARHQLTECQRVEQARDAFTANDPDLLGSLMNASHESCAHDYQVSCDELDKLVQIARESGAIGARLTGAGMGGCTVNLVPADKLDNFVAAVAERYYGEYMTSRGRLGAIPAIHKVKASPAAGYISHTNNALCYVP